MTQSSPAAAAAAVEQRTLKQALAECEAVLFDFDGPLCRLFAPAPNEREYGGHRLAEALKEHLYQREVMPLVEELETSRDPHEIYRTACTALLRKDPSGFAEIIADLRRELDDFEVAAAAATATPTADAHDLVKALVDAGKDLAVTSNNAAAAVTAFLNRADVNLFDHFKNRIFGREEAEFMKPHPRSLLIASRELDRHPGKCLMIGDSTADAEAARAAGVLFCGYARDDRMRTRLVDAGVNPEWIVSSMTELHALTL